MLIYRHFIIQLLRNYIVGSVAAVLGVGGVLMFSSLQVTHSEYVVLAAILFTSLFIMMIAELSVFQRDLKPIRSVYRKSDSKAPTVAELQEAYIQTHRFPALAVRRIFGPHLFGLAVPASGFALLAIWQQWLMLPVRYVLVAAPAAVLVASMHALIEFYLTTAAIRPILTDVTARAEREYGSNLTLDGRVLVTIRRKFILSAFLIGTFPLFLFAIATNIQLSEASMELHNGYWKWTGVILLIGTAFSSAGAWLMSRDIQHPISELQGRMLEVQQGRLNVDAADVYSDEFSRLIAGFSHMVRGLKERDRLNKQLLQSYFATLAAALDARDPYTAGHSLRVAEYSVMIGRRYGLCETDLDLLNKTALLHDIGKIGIRDTVLLKDGRLTDEEFEAIKSHPVTGEAILRSVEPKEAMGPLLPGVRSHHERYDGKGYPDGLSGEDIPLFGRIIAVADAYDAMTSDRPYRKGMQTEKALGILAEGRGTQWDSVFVDHFLYVMGKHQRKSG